MMLGQCVINFREKVTSFKHTVFYRIKNHACLKVVKVEWYGTMQDRLMELSRQNEPYQKA